MKDFKELQDLLDQGYSQRKLAEHFKCSQTTVRYWLGRHNLKTKNLNHGKKYGPDDPRYIERECRHHGSTSFIWEPSKHGYRCVACRSGNVAKKRRRLKLELIEKLGGKCKQCGYNKSPWALHFHHKNPQNKLASVGEFIQRQQINLARKEAMKCDLLCANCHAEEEAKKWMSNSLTI